MLDGLFARLRSVVRRDTVAEEMEEELREHLERATELHIRRGLSPDEARLAARRDLGNTTIVADEARAAWGGFSLDDLRRDVRHGIRALLRTPGFSVVVIITLAFGFGVNGAMLGMVRGALNLSPVPQPETWVRVPGLWSNAAYEYLRDSVHSLTGLSASAQQSVLVRAGNGQAAEEVSATFVSGNFFDELQGRPILGRTFGADEIAPPAGEPVVIVGHRFWMRRLAGDSGAIGAVLRLGSGQAFTVIGVMPRTFTGGSPRGPDLWLPLGARTRLPGDGDQVRSFGDDSWFGPTGREFLFLSGRIAPGRSFEEVRTELRLRVGQIARADDSTLAGSIAANLSTAQMSAMAKGEEAVVAVLILAIPVCVLLIASVTVANLMLARAATRRREMGIQVALGASRSRVIRAWLTECLVLGGTAPALDCCCHLLRCVASRPAGRSGLLTCRSTWTSWPAALRRTWRWSSTWPSSSS